ncbi:hypothetical protein KM043_000788 [Ampulex compressa]|nr:hypothetical protein KM043_000788 [Ampulex compressa]
MIPLKKNRITEDGTAPRSLPDPVFDAAVHEPRPGGSFRLVRESHPRLRDPCAYLKVLESLEFQRASSCPSAVPPVVGSTTLWGDLAYGNRVLRRSNSVIEPHREINAGRRSLAQSFTVANGRVFELSTNSSSGSNLTIAQKSVRSGIELRRTSTLRRRKKEKKKETTGVGAKRRPVARTLNGPVRSLHMAKQIQRPLIIGRQ